MQRTVLAFAALCFSVVTIADDGRNLIPNSSFEAVADGIPLGWSWRQGAATGILTVDQSEPHTGRQGLQLTNSAAMAPNIYSCLQTTVPVLPERTYTLSAYVRGEKPGSAWIGGGNGWRVRMYLPEGATQWRRMARTFRTQPGENRFDVIISTDSPTAGFWVDSVQLEEGGEATEYVPPLSPGEMRLNIESGAEAGLGVNLIPNASFEVLDGERPRGWKWDRRNTDAAFEVTDDAHSGRNAARVANTTPFGPHVYGQLVLQGGVPLTPGETYTLSFYAKSTNPGIAWVGGGSGWWMRLPLQDTAGRWKRFSKTFVARDEDASFPLMVNTDGPTPGFLVDDIKLELGPRATDSIDTASIDQPLKLFLDAPDVLATGSPSVTLTAFAYLADGQAPVSVTAAAARDGAQVAGTAPGPPLEPGVSRLTIVWAPEPSVTRDYTLTIVAGSERAEASFELFTMSDFAAARREADEQVETLRQLLGTRDEGLPADYATAALAIADRFMKVAERKAVADLVPEAVDDAMFIGHVCREQADRLEAMARGDLAPMPIPRPDLSALTVRDGCFRAGDEPVMLIGALGYGELLDELDTYKDYGFNIIGDDFNSYSAFRMVTSDTDFDETALPRLIESWDRLAEMNLAVSYNPTLHYFPEWALGKYVDITGGDPVDRLPDWSGLGRHAGSRTKSYGGFFPFAIDSPNLRRLVSRYYGKLMPAIKDHAGFQMIWLMNEPTYGSEDPHYIGLFREYLEARFGGVAAANAAWGTDLDSFDDIAQLVVQGGPARFDWLTFHQDQVASWFEWLAGQIRRHYPGAVLSNKPMAWTWLDPERGIDFEREAELWDVPGCDAGRSPGHADYSFGWMGAAMLFDFQHSVAPRKPLGDHEYHYVHEAGVSSEYVRASYFQSYLHGLRTSEFWVWATGLIGEGDAGAGMKHTAWSQPKVAWGTSTSALDLRRLARYVAAFPGTPQVHLYVSRPSLYVDNPNHKGAIHRAYEAANGLDAPLGFMTDRMIRKRRLDECRLLIIPEARYIQADVLEAVAKFAAEGGAVLCIGEECLAYDEYKRPYETMPAGLEVTQAAARTREQLVPELEAAFTAAGISRPVRALTEEGQPAWPVECRTQVADGRRVCAIVGLNKEPMTVHLTSDRPITGAQDLITNETIVGNQIKVKPLDVYMLRLND